MPGSGSSSPQHTRPQRTRLLRAGRGTVAVVVGIASLDRDADPPPATGVLVRADPPVDPESRGRLMDLLEDAVVDGGSVLVVHPEHLSGTVGPVVRAARGLLRSTRIALVPVDLPPLATAVLAAAVPAAHRAAGSGPGELAAVLDALAARLPWSAWVVSARRLTGRRAGRGVRWWSLLGLPAGFTLHSGSASVQRPHRDRPIDGPVRAAVVTGSARGRAQLLALLHEADRPACAVASVPPAELRRWSGSRRTAELVVLPDTLDGLARAARDEVLLTPCGWCELPVAAATCPFCGHTPGRPAPPAPEEP